LTIIYRLKFVYFKKGTSNTMIENIPRSNLSQSIKFVQSNKSNSKMQKANQLQKPMSKLAIYVLHFPIPETIQFQHERNQRFVVLYGFGSKK
jgi:hypothetical protein